jgi:hypothetical protein
MNNPSYIIPQFALILLVIGFGLFLFQISPGIRKLIKRNRKIAKRRNNIKQASKARDFQI